MITFTHPQDQSILTAYMTKRKNTANESLGFGIICIHQERWGFLRWGKFPMNLDNPSEISPESATNHHSRILR